MSKKEEILHKLSTEDRNYIKEKFKEKDQAIESLQEINQSLGQTCNNDAKEIERLREKENLLNLIVDGYYTPTNIVERQIREQNQTAIAELEKVKEFARKRIEQLNGMEEKTISVIATGLACVWFIDQIDQQIAELKGEK